MVDFQCTRFGIDLCFEGNCTLATPAPAAYQSCACGSQEVILDNAYVHNFGTPPAHAPSSLPGKRDGH